MYYFTLFYLIINYYLSYFNIIILKVNKFIIKINYDGMTV